MSAPRLPALQDFLASLRQTMLGAVCGGHPPRDVIERIFAAVERAAAQTHATAAVRMPVCAEFAPACRTARRHSPELAALADALAVLEPDLHWSRRPGAETHGARFARNHANAVIVGEGGLAASEAVRIGVSLLAPRTTYPDHRHPPEEVYIALSPGEWRQGDGPWRAPGVGGLVHNPPNIEHAMRSAEAPLLAVWCLDIAGTA
jgi:quercetin dioxygenase-like cupin family protein